MKLSTTFCIIGHIACRIRGLIVLYPASLNLVPSPAKPISIFILVYPQLLSSRTVNQSMLVYLCCACMSKTLCPTICPKHLVICWETLNQTSHSWDSFSQYTSPVSSNPSSKILRMMSFWVPWIMLPLCLLLCSVSVGLHTSLVLLGYALSSILPNRHIM